MAVLRLDIAGNTLLVKNNPKQLIDKAYGDLREIVNSAVVSRLGRLWTWEGDGLLWMNTGRDCLFLFPPRAKCAEAAIKTCIGMIVSAPLFVLETFGISIPANFIFAMHYGTVTYKPPGKTGTVVSDAVNSIFHLGAKKSEPGRLTISGELPDVSIPANLQDLFVPAGEYEGRKIWHTKKFSYAKPWF
jgi:hypothetical protein